MPETSEPIQFKSETANLVFNTLVDFFIEDYMVKKYVAEKSGWRTLAEIAQKAHVSTSVLYGKTSTLGPSLEEPLRRGLIETRIFPGERGRGGEVMRIRIPYEKDPIRELVSRRIRLGKEPRSTISDPNDEKIVKVLSESPLLSSLQEGQIKKIIQLSEKPIFSSNEFIVKEGDLASGFFIIIDGQVEARQRGKSVRRMGRGQFFGETSLTEHQTRSADVIAVQPTTCLKLNAAQLKELINLDPQIAVTLLEETVRRNRDVTRTSIGE
jgi:CRP/FNR family cyclic AMP-dependent transcriptional regulator